MTEATLRMHLPVRRPMLPDEWPETYLLSLARAQGLRRAWGYDVELIRSVLPWERPMSTGNQPASESASPYLQGRPQYGANPLPSWASIVRAMPLRYCPHCLLEQRYFRTRWRFSGFHACTFHGCYLKSDLVDQALTANYNREGRLKFADATDEQILNAALCCLPHELHATKMVWQPLELMAQRAESPRENEALGELASWTVMLWRLLEEISRIHHKKVIGQPTTGLLPGVGRLSRDLGIVTAPSLDGVQAMFAGLRENAHLLAARRFIDGLIGQEGKTPTALSALPLEVLRERLMCFAPVATPRTPHGGMAFRDLREHAVNKSVLLEDLAPLGGGPELVNRWIRCKLITTVKVIREGMAFTFIEREHARQARRALLSLIHARDFVAQHDLDWCTYKAIRDIGLINTGALGLRGYLHRKDIAALIAQLELMSAPVHEASSLRWPLFCETTLHCAEQRATFLALVRAAIQGRIRVYRELSRPGLSAFSIGVDGIVWMARRRRAFFYERKWRPAVGQRGLFDAQEEGAAA
ncbi:TniQ family protein [Roseateles microcysteis]|uniref:TniQ family protein n=1 Tax=Roseateles microcysteis TaxID=3119057 RepID=UPI002FE54CD9